MIGLLLLLLSTGSCRGASLRSYRVRFGHRGLTQIHHVIPKQHRQHPTLRRAGFDVHARCNLVFLPTSLGREHLALHPDRPCHENGHVRYNEFVGHALDNTAPDHVPALLRSLKQSMRHLDVPWR